MAKTTERHNADKAKKSLLQKFSETDSVLIGFNKALIASGKRRNERKSARDAIAASRQARRQGDAVILNYSPSDLVCDTLFVLQVPATMMKETTLRLQTQTWR
jgi:hypothetical protein